MSIIFEILSIAFNVYFYATIVYVFMSWIPGARDTQIGLFLEKICEPYLEVFRRFIPPIGMIDFSPIVALLVLQFAMQGLHSLERFFVFL